MVSRGTESNSLRKSQAPEHSLQDYNATQVYLGGKWQRNVLLTITSKLTFKSSPQETTLKRQRNVSFCETLVVASYDDQRADDRASLTWYGPKDYERFSADARKCIRKVKEEAARGGDNRSETFSKAIHDVFLTACRSPAKAANGSFLAPGERKRLVRAYKSLGGRKLIGLEYYAVQAVRDMANQQREKMVFMVEFVQPCYTPDTIDEQEAVAQKLATRCTEFSNASCAMAQFLAQIHCHL